MDVQPPEFCLGTGGIEVFIFDLAHRAAVTGVGIVGAKALHVELVRTPADLLIGGKADLQGGMFSSLCDQLLRRRHDLRHTGLVVRTQQCGTVGDNQMLADMIFQGRIVADLHPDALSFVQQDIAAVAFHDPGLDVRAGGVGRGIHVGDQADGGKAGIAGNGAVDIAVFVHEGIGDAHLLHFFHQGCTQQFLLGRRGAGLRKFVGHGIEGHIF